MYYKLFRCILKTNTIFIVIAKLKYVLIFNDNAI